MLGRFTKLKIFHFDRFVTLLIAGLIFFTPTNWFIKLSQNQAYVHGLFSDYLLVKIYPTDVLVLILLIILLCRFFSKPSWSQFIQKNKLLAISYGCLSLILILRPIFTPYVWTGALSALRLILLSGLVILLRHWWLQLSQPILARSKLSISWSLLTTIVLQSSLGLYQFFWQKSLIGYQFLGEAQLANSIGIAHFNWWGHELVLPYGTTAHPNVLAGVLVFFLVISWGLLAKSESRITRWCLWLATLLGASALLATTSVSGLLAGLLAIVGFQYLKLIKLGRLSMINVSWLKLGWWLFVIAAPFLLFYLAIVLPTNLSALRRSNLNQAAINMIYKQPIFGTGVGLFTANLDRYLPKFEPVVFLQPVHHVPLLFLVQTGTVGLAWLICWLRLLKKSDQNTQSKLTNILPIPSLMIGLMVLPLMTLDHYLISLQTGLMLFSLIIVFGSGDHSRQ